MMLIVGWWTCSITLSAYNKYLFGPSLERHVHLLQGGTPSSASSSNNNNPSDDDGSVNDGGNEGFVFYPLFTTSIHMLLHSLISLLVLGYIHSLNSPLNHTTTTTTTLKPYSSTLKSIYESLKYPLHRLTQIPSKTWCKLILPIALFALADLSLSTLSLASPSVSLAMYTMFKSTTPLFVLLVAFALRLERVSARLIMCVLGMCAGVGMMAYRPHSQTQTQISQISQSETQTNLDGGAGGDDGGGSGYVWGVIMLVSASLMSALKWAFTQLLLSSSHHHTHSHHNHSSSNNNNNSNSSRRVNYGSMNNEGDLEMTSLKSEETVIFDRGVGSTSNIQDSQRDLNGEFEVPPITPASAKLISHDTPVSAEPPQPQTSQNNQNTQNNNQDNGQEEEGDLSMGLANSEDGDGDERMTLSSSISLSSQGRSSDSELDLDDGAFLTKPENQPMNRSTKLGPLSMLITSMKTHFETTLTLSPLIFVLILSLSLIVEHPYSPLHPVPLTHHHVSITSPLIGSLMISLGAFLALVMVLCEFALVDMQDGGVVFLSVMGMGKEVVTLGVAVVVFGDRVGAWQWRGVFVTLLGIGYFNYLRYLRMKGQSELRDGGEGDHGEDEEVVQEA